MTPEHHAEALSQLAASGPLGAVCCVLIYVIVRLFNMYVVEKDQRIKDAQTYADLVSKKDKDVQIEKDHRIKDSDAFRQTHSALTHEAYLFESTLEELGTRVANLQALIVERIRIAEQKEREKLERDLQDAKQHQLQSTGPQLPWTPRKKAPSHGGNDE